MIRTLTAFVLAAMLWLPSIPEETVAARCLRYLPAVMAVSPDYPALHPAMVLAVAARETGCDPRATDGQFHGLMAVAGDRSWTTSRENLMDVTTNVRYGMWLLNRALMENPRNPEHNMRLALAVYNCGWPRIDAGRCTGSRGFAYADDILDFWYPLMHSRLWQHAWRIRDNGPWLEARALWILEWYGWRE